MHTQELATALEQLVDNHTLYSVVEALAAKQLNNAAQRVSAL